MYNCRPSGFRPTGFRPTVFLPSDFRPRGFRPRGFCPSVFRHSVLLPPKYPKITKTFIDMMIVFPFLFIYFYFVLVTTVVYKHHCSTVAARPYFVYVQITYTDLLVKQVLQ